ncbi:MAG: hypothetical protein K6E41_04860 [Solobacterium sp.]|nr:hypothetical protein [Solobacterium sp.]
MDRTVIKKSYKERAQVGQTFLSHLLTVCAAAILVCAAALAYLWFWLDRYEKHSVNGAMTNYMQLVANKQWDEIYEMDVENFVELNSKEVITSYLTYLYADCNMNGMTFSYAGEDGYSAYYDVYYQQKKLCSLEARKPEGSSVWKVRTVNQNHTYTFDVLDGTPFSINGNEITDFYIHEDRPAPLEFADLSMEMPETVRYTIGGFIYAPEPEVPAGYIAVRDYLAPHFYLGRAPDSIQQEEFSRNIEETAIAYCRYITKDGTFNALNQHLYPYTEFYYNILGFNPQWYSAHDSAVFTNVKVFDMLALGGNAFVGTISFDYIVSAEDAGRTESSTYQLFFVKNSQGNWRLINLAIVDSSTS